MKNFYYGIHQPPTNEQVAEQVNPEEELHVVLPVHVLLAPRQVYPLQVGVLLQVLANAQVVPVPHEGPPQV